MSRLDAVTLNTIRELEAEGTPGLLNQLIDLFFETSEDALMKIQAGAEKQAQNQIREAAHSLKSSAAGLGARKLAALCQELETQMKSKAIDAETHVQIQEIRNELEVIRPDLAALRT